MKKFVFGAVIGALLTLGVSAAADGISKIGKTITNEYVVTVDGLSLDVKAIAVDGTSYAPVRAIASAAGFGVDFRNDEVLLTSDTNGIPKGELTLSKEEIAEKIEWWGKMINSYKINIAGLEHSYSRITEESERAETQSWIEYHNDLIVEAEKEIAELQAQLTQLAE